MNYHQLVNILKIIELKYIAVYMLSMINPDLMQERELEGNCIPVCGANLITPVIDQAGYIEEIRYRIGGITYIENAD